MDLEVKEITSDNTDMAQGVFLDLVWNQKLWSQENLAALLN